MTWNFPLKIKSESLNCQNLHGFMICSSFRMFVPRFGQLGFLYGFMFYFLNVPVSRVS